MFKVHSWWFVLHVNDFRTSDYIIYILANRQIVFNSVQSKKTTAFFLFGVCSRQLERRDDRICYFCRLQSSKSVDSSHVVMVCMPVCTYFSQNISALTKPLYFLKYNVILLVIEKDDCIWRFCLLQSSVVSFL